jgi:hypothetical protein
MTDARYEILRESLKYPPQGIGALISHIAVIFPQSLAGVGSAVMTACVDTYAHCEG